MMEHGFQRLVLLNSAGYQRAELPLDASVSLVAPNNTGKTSLINALQFLLIIDRRRMDFGAHDFDRSRRFYFPHNSAYILLEVLLPDRGCVVLGCVGKGVSHDYEYFAYAGALELDDYRLEDGSLVAQPQLLAHLASRDRLAHQYSSADFAAMLYGGKRRRGEEEGFRIFRLERPTQADVFRSVLTRTLRLDKLQSKEVKDYLLQIFRHELPDSSIDFKQEWDQAFAGVNADRAQYQAALAQQARIAQLEALHEERLQLRGKLGFYRPRIEQNLLDWRAHYQQQSAQLQQDGSRLRLEDQQLQADTHQWIREQGDAERDRRDLQKTAARQADLENQFALVGRRQLEQAVDAARQDYASQLAALANAESRSPQQIRSERVRVERELQAVQREQASLQGNLFQSLQRALPEQQLAALNQLFAREVMTLGEQEFALDDAQLKQSLSGWLAKPGCIELPGLRLQLDSLVAQHQQRSAEAIGIELEALQQQLDRLDEQLQVAEQLAQARVRRDELERALRDAERALELYDELLSLREQEAERTDRLRWLDEHLQQLQALLAGAEGKREALQQSQQTLVQQMQALQQANQTISQLRERRRDSTPLFGYLADLPHHPWVQASELALQDLAEHLQGYQRDCSRLLQIEQEVSGILGELHTGGLTRYQMLDAPDEEVRRIIEFARLLPQEFEAIEHKARSAVVNVTACLRSLRSGLDTFKSRMREFNQLISGRRLSDLEVFRIEPEDERELVEAVDTIISTAAQINSGETFELFNHASVLDDDKLNRAKTLLIREGEARAGLRMEQLFRLNFIVGKPGQKPQAFADMDSAASNGTVLMAKLVTGLALLHKMQDKRHGVRAACYLDEALALDGPNQRSLIEAAAEFGFALIFASPAPLATARYCVPISQHAGFNQISRKSWQVIEPIEERPA